MPVLGMLIAFVGTFVTISVFDTPWPASLLIGLAFGVLGGVVSASRA